MASIGKIGEMVLKELKLGVMQGRLLPKFQGRYQAHPIGYWQDEFPIASSLNLDCIEFILDFDKFEENPLIYSGGSKEIVELIHQTNVSVNSICADYFMESPLHSEDLSKVNEGIKVLKHLINISPSLGVNNIVIPCVDSSSLKTEKQKNCFVESLSQCLSDAEKNSVYLSLETDLNPHDFRNLLEKFSNKMVSVNYDIGNSASLGYDFIEEFKFYGNFITDVHIKDRVKNGGSVFLGTGNANLNEVFTCLNKLSYNGILIMQAYRDDEGLIIFKEQLKYVQSLLQNL